MKQRKKRKSYKNLFSYYFDLWLSKGTVSMVILLFVITGVLILILSILMIIFCSSRGINFVQAVWGTLTHTLDPGVLAGDEGTVVFLFLMLLATLCGVFFTALLIGTINDGISGRVNELSKGLEPVIENDHVVILGFNESTFIIISELIEAYANQKGKRHAVVIMDHYDKQEMEARIRTQFPNTGNIKIVCRGGETYNQNDLIRCSIATSKSVIIAQEHDFETIKTIIACTQLLNECEDSKSFVTAVINQKEYELAARISGNDENISDQLFSVENDRLELLMLESTISKIMTHTSRQGGLSKVFIEVFNYEGNEFYIVRNEGRDKEVFKKLSGKTIREINQRLTNAIAIGVIDAKGNVQIDDPDKVVLREDCKLVVLEEDDNRIVINNSIPETSYTSPTILYEDKPSTILIMDCNSKLPTVLGEMGHYLCPGSLIYLAADPNELDSIVSDNYLKRLEDQGESKSLTIRKCSIGSQDNTNVYDYINLHKLLEECQPDYLLIMSSQTLDNEEADARSLKLLLYCKYYKNLHPEKNFDVTCEMRNVANQHLADSLMTSDYVVSRNIAALMMAQIAENRELKAVFEILLNSEGFEIYMKPAKYYLNITGETEVSLFSLSEAVAEKHEIFIGYKLNSKENGDAALCPDKVQNGKPVSITLHEDDQFIVLAEDIKVI